MSRLIDADALKKAFCKQLCGNDDCEECDIKVVIDQAPTIDPTRHGHWKGWTATHWTKKYDNNGDPIYKEHTYYQCSECRRRTVIRSAYCPACGCKMDEVSE